MSDSNLPARDEMSTTNSEKCSDNVTGNDTVAQDSQPPNGVSSGTGTSSPSGASAHVDQSNDVDAGMQKSDPPVGLSSVGSYPGAQDGRIVERSAVITGARQLPRDGCGGPKVFWMRKNADGKEPPKSCFEGFTGVDNSAEIPESELTTVPLETKEQRLDWRDFLCEMVASNNALTLFNSYDVGADPPKYSRPPPSVPQVDAIAQCQMQSGRIPPRCVAPNGTGFSPPEDDASRSGAGPRLKSAFERSIEPLSGDSGEATGEKEDPLP